MRSAFRTTRANGICRAGCRRRHRAWSAAAWSSHVLFGRHDRVPALLDAERIPGEQVCDQLLAQQLRDEFNLDRYCPRWNSGLHHTPHTTDTKLLRSATHMSTCSRFSFVTNGVV